MVQILEIPRKVTWTSRVTDLKVGERLERISMAHYRTVTSLVSSKSFKFQYPAMVFKSEVSEDGKTFDVIRKEDRA